MPIMNAGASYASTHTEAALHCSQARRYVQVHTYSVFPRARKDPMVELAWLKSCRVLL